MRPSFAKRMGRAFSSIAVALLAIFAATTYSGSLRASDRDIAIGGVDGVEDLANPDNTRELRASGRVRLYMHLSAWSKMDDRTRAAVVTAFAGTGPAWLEVNESGHGDVYWSQWAAKFRVIGFVADQAFVNAASASKPTLTFDQWKTYVDAARSHGIQIVAPIITPNDRSWMGHPFAGHEWDDARVRAQYGGGLTVDVPGWYFLSHPRDYQKFIGDELRWAREAGLRATLILSPPRQNTGMGDFDGQTQKMLRMLQAEDALPNQYVIENYMGNPPPNFRYTIGREGDNQSVAGVTHWVVHNMPRKR